MTQRMRMGEMRRTLGLALVEPGHAIEAMANSLPEAVSDQLAFDLAAHSGQRMLASGQRLNDSERIESVQLAVSHYIDFWGPGRN